LLSADRFFSLSGDGWNWSEGGPWQQSFTLLGFSTNPGTFMIASGSTTVPTPEPATVLLFGTGLIGLAGFSRKKFLKKQTKSVG